MILLSFMIFWLICSSLAAGFYLSNVHNKYSLISEKYYRENLGMAWILSLLLGPVSLILSLFLTGFWEYGWMNPFKLKV